MADIVYEMMLDQKKFTRPLKEAGDESAKFGDTLARRIGMARAEVNKLAQDFVQSGSVTRSELQQSINNLDRLERVAARVRETIKDMSPGAVLAGVSRSRGHESTEQRLSRVNAAIARVTESYIRQGRVGGDVLDRLIAQQQELIAAERTKEGMIERSTAAYQRQQASALRLMSPLGQEQWMAQQSMAASRGFTGAGMRGMGGRGRGGFGGMGNNAAFMISQGGFAVEDFLTQYSTMGVGGGLRAAGNNLSVIAAMINPIAGIIVGVGTALGAILIPKLLATGDAARKAGQGLDDFAAGKSAGKEGRGSTVGGLGRFGFLQGIRERATEAATRARLLRTGSEEDVRGIIAQDRDRLTGARGALSDIDAALASQRGVMSRVGLDSPARARLEAELDELLAKRKEIVVELNAAEGGLVQSQKMLRAAMNRLVIRPGGDVSYGQSFIWSAGAAQMRNETNAKNEAIRQRNLTTNGFGVPFDTLAAQQGRTNENNMRIVREQGIRRLGQAALQRDILTGGPMGEALNKQLEERRKKIAGIRTEIGQTTENIRRYEGERQAAEGMGDTERAGRLAAQIENARMARGGLQGKLRGEMSAEAQLAGLLQNRGMLQGRTGPLYAPGGVTSKNYADTMVERMSAEQERKTEKWRQDQIKKLDEQIEEAKRTNELLEDIAAGGGGLKPANIGRAG